MNVREKWWLVFDIVLPLVGVCAYVFVYRANGAHPDLIGFVILGGAMSAYWMNVLWAMGNQLFWEKETGNLALYIMAPNSMMAILLGMALGGMVTTTLRAASILAIGSLMFGVRFDVSNAPLLLLVFALALVALYGMGMMFASMFLLFGREGWHLVNLAQEPVFLLSGTFFPVRQLQFLGGRRRVDYSADAGTRRDPATDVLVGCRARISRCRHRGRRPGGSERRVLDSRALSTRPPGAAGYCGRAAD